MVSEEVTPMPLSEAAVTAGVLRRFHVPTISRPARADTEHRPLVGTRS